MKIKNLFFIALLIPHIINAQWIKTNLLIPSASQIYNIMSNDKTLFLTVYPTFLLRSTDNGTNWESAQSGLPHDAALLTKVVYNSRNNHYYCVDGAQLYSSSNSGGTWLRISSVDDQRINYIYDFQLDMQGNIIVGSLNGVFKTYDEGKTWSDLKFNSDTIYHNNSAWKLLLDRNENAYVLKQNTRCLYRYNMQTEEWNITSTLPNSNNEVIIDYVVSSSGVIMTQDVRGNIFVSKDGGKSWDNKFSSGRTICIDNLDNLYVTAGNWIYKSSNYGDGWNIIFDSPEYQPEGIFALPDGRLFVNYYNFIKDGTFVSSDMGKTWNPFVFQCASITSVAIASNGCIFAGSKSAKSGLYFSEDQGITWSSSNRLGGKNILSIATNSNNSVEVITNDSVFCSTNNGATWNSNQNNSRTQSMVDNNNIFYRGGSVFSGTGTQVHIDRSTDNGITWAEVAYIGSVLGGLAVSGNNIFAQTRWDGSGGFGPTSYQIYRSTDSGNSWYKVLSKDPQEALQPVYSNSTGLVFTSSKLGVYRSTDYGDSWNIIDTMEQHTYLANFVFGKNSVAYATNSIGLFKSVDNGITWLLIDSLKMFSVNKMVIDKNNQLFIATDKSGLLKSDILINIDRNELLPSNNSLSQNYPNPFNPTTTINYSIPEVNLPSREGNGRGVLVTLKVYDMIGREIATLINEQKATGNYEVTFNGASLPSGIYFYRMQTGSFSQTKKFVLLK